MLSLSNAVAPAHNQLTHPKGRFVLKVLGFDHANVQKKMDFAIDDKDEASGFYYGIRVYEGTPLPAHFHESDNALKGYRKGVEAIKPFVKSSVVMAELDSPVRSYAITRDELLQFVLLPKSNWWSVDQMCQSVLLTIINNELNDDSIEVNIFDGNGPLSPNVLKKLPEQGYQLHLTNRDRVALTNDDWDYYLYLEDCRLSETIMSDYMQ